MTPDEALQRRFQKVVSGTIGVALFATLGYVMWTDTRPAEGPARVALLGLVAIATLGLYFQGELTDAGDAAASAAWARATAAIRRVGADLRARWHAAADLRGRWRAAWPDVAVVSGICLLAYTLSAPGYADDRQLTIAAGAGLVAVGVIAWRRHTR